MLFQHKTEGKPGIIQVFSADSLLKRDPNENLFKKYLDILRQKLVFEIFVTLSYKRGSDFEKRQRVLITFY